MLYSKNMYQLTHPLTVMRFGGMAAKNSAIGRYAANAFKKSVNPPPLK